eukprot:gene17575-20241_t
MERNLKPSISNKMEAASLILKGLVIEDVNRRETERERGWREYKEYQASEGRVVEDDLVPDENEAFLFYTVEEFEQLIKFIAAQEELKEEYADRLTYARRLTPVPMWCEMARSALPVNTEEIWLSKDQAKIDDVTNRLVAKQKQLRALYRNMIVKTFTNLPDELARAIAEFSGPVALNVRVAFKDDEGQSCELIKAARKCMQFAMEKKDATHQQLRDHLKQSTTGRCQPSRIHRSDTYEDMTGYCMDTFHGHDYFSVDCMAVSQGDDASSLTGRKDAVGPSVGTSVL